MLDICALWPFVFGLEVQRQICFIINVSFRFQWQLNYQIFINDCTHHGLDLPESHAFEPAVAVCTPAMVIFVDMCDQVVLQGLVFVRLVMFNCTYVIAYVFRV